METYPSVNMNLCFPIYFSSKSLFSKFQISSQLIVVTGQYLVTLKRTVCHFLGKAQTASFMSLFDTFHRYQASQSGKWGDLCNLKQTVSCFLTYILSDSSHHSNQQISVSQIILLSLCTVSVASLVEQISQLPDRICSIFYLSLAHGFAMDHKLLLTTPEHIRTKSLEN